MSPSHRPIRLLAGVLLLPSLTSCAPSAAEPFDVVEANISELQQAMASGTTSSVLITTAYLARIEAYDKAGAELNAMIRINPNALEEAEALDRVRTTRGPQRPLARDPHNPEGQLRSGPACPRRRLRLGSPASCLPTTASR